MSLKYPSMNKSLTERRSVVVREWLRQTLECHPASAPLCLSTLEDPLRNPAGHILRAGLAELWDGIVSGAEPGALAEALQDIIKLRAVQEPTPGRAVSFIFLLKPILRELFQEDEALSSEEIRTLEQRIDDLALQAIDVFVLCRERIHEIRAREARRMHFLPQRLQQRRASEARVKG